MVAPTCPSLFGPSSLKVNNINIHPGMAEKIPKTSSPANSHIPQIQDLTGISPMVAAEGTEPYSVVPLTYKQKPEISLASVNTGISYTDSSTIRYKDNELMNSQDIDHVICYNSSALIG